MVCASGLADDCASGDCIRNDARGVSARTDGARVMAGGDECSTRVVSCGSELSLSIDGGGSSDGCLDSGGPSDGCLDGGGPRNGCLDGGGPSERRKPG